MDGYITKWQALYLVSYAANTGNLEQARKMLDAYCAWNKSDRRDDCGVDDGAPKEIGVKYCPNGEAKMERRVEIIENLLEVIAISSNTCSYILELRTGSTECGFNGCKNCEKENLAWLKSWGC